MNASYKNNLNLQRAGEVLIRCLWLEKRLVDLILLRQNPSLKDDFNSGAISEPHSKLRLDWHRHTFSYVIAKFLNEFPEIAEKDRQHVENIYFLNELRDLISHGDMSYYRDNILFVPKDVKRRTIFDSRTFPTNTGQDDGTRVLNLKNEETYKAILAILDDWEKIVEAVAQGYGVHPEKIK